MASVLASCALQTEVSYDYPRDAFLVSAGAAYVPGQQVFISYGAQNNDSLMQVGLLLTAFCCNCALEPRLEAHGFLQLMIM